MNLQELIEKRKQLVATMQTKLDEATKALGDGNTEQVESLQKEAAEYGAKVKTYTSQIEALREAEKASKADFSEPEPEPQPEPEPVVKTAVRPPFETDAEPKEEGDVVAKAVNILRHGTVDAQTEVLIKELYGNDYGNKRVRQRQVFSKYLRDGRFDSVEDERLLKTAILLPEQVEDGVRQDVSYKTMKATLQEVSGELGGFVVPEDWRAEVIRRLQGLTVVRGRARQINTTRDAVEWPRLLGGNSQYTSAMRGTWINEKPANASGAESNPTFGTLRIPINTYMIRTDISKNLTEDSAVDLPMLLAQLYAETAAIDEDTAFLTGAGGDSPKGILGNRSGAEKTPADGIGTTNSGNASALEPDGLIDLVYALDSQYRQNAILVGATATHGAVRKMKDGNSDYLWVRGLQPGEPATLLNYPFYESESMPAITANAYPVIFGDFGGYLIADRVGMTVSRVEDATTHGQNLVAYFLRRRLGGGVIEPYKFRAQKVAS